MSELTKSQLQSDIDARIYQNTNGEISGTDVNEVLTNINDSKASLKDSNAFVGNVTALNISGTNTGDETTSTLGTKIANATEKTTPIDADFVGIVDSAASNVLKKLSWANVKATLKTYFDTIYATALGYTPENVTNKSTNTNLGTSDTLYPSQNAVKTYVDAIVTGLWDDRGSFNASGGSYPTTGGSGTAGAIKKGDVWTVSVAGTLPTGQVVEVGDIVRALIDTPGQTQSNWAITQNNIGYTAENTANKSTSIVTDQASNTKYPTVKSVFDWATTTFQTVLGFTPENVTNKENTTIDTSTTKYPTVNLLKTGLDTKEPSLPTKTGNALKYLRVNSGATGLEWADASSGGGIAGTNIIYVPGNGTQTQNGSALTTAYLTAQSMSPSSSNRITIIVAPGKYQLETNITMSTSYIDIVSLTGNPDVVLITSNITTACNDAKIKGITSAKDSSKILLSGANSEIIIENCVMGDNSFNCSNYDLQATFINCSANSNSFGYNSAYDITGKFYNCNSTTYGFGSKSNITTAYFENCKGEAYCFGSVTGVANGIFVDCTAGLYSFGYQIPCNGSFTRCVAGDYSFGYENTITGIFTDCIGGSYSFGYGFSVAGTFINCKGNDNCFGSSTSFLADETIAGNYYNCIANSNSFGHRIENVSGYFSNCKAIDNSFGYSDRRDDYVVVTATFINCVGNDYCFSHKAYTSGIYKDCIALYYGFCYDNIADGSFENCIGSDNCFSSGDNGAASGIFQNCKSGNASFGYSSANGTFINCLSGDDSFHYGFSETRCTGYFYHCIGKSNCFSPTQTFSGKAFSCVANNSCFANTSPSIVLDGQLYYCKIIDAANTFQTVTSPGRTVYCVDGDDIVNNQ